MDNSLRSFNPSNVAAGSSTLSNTFQILPASINKALLSEPKRLNLYYALKDNLKLASLKSFTALVLPGPRS